MTEQEILVLVKQNLSIMHTAQDEYLASLITTSESSIKEDGITLDLGDAKDVNLVVMYTAYLFRKRAEDNPVMPRMLRYALNNRLFSEKARVTS
jgi:hypothetical protein